MSSPGSYSCCWYTEQGGLKKNLCLWTLNKGSTQEYVAHHTESHSNLAQYSSIQQPPYSLPTLSKLLLTHWQMAFGNPFLVRELAHNIASIAIPYKPVDPSSKARQYIIVTKNSDRWTSPQIHQVPCCPAAPYNCIQANYMTHGWIMKGKRNEILNVVCVDN